MKSKVINNGYMSQEIDIGRGLRQCSPLSCLLFDLVIEVIAIRIRQNHNIEGISIGTTSKKLGQYADDLWISIKHKKKCYVNLFKELDDYARFTGLKINYDRTEIIQLGSLVYADAQFYSNFPLHWSDTPVKILGIYFWLDRRVMVELNYNKTLDKIKNICTLWGKRSDIAWKNTNH